MGLWTSSLGCYNAYLHSTAHPVTVCNIKNNRYNLFIIWPKITIFTPVTTNIRESWSTKLQFISYLWACCLELLRVTCRNFSKYKTMSGYNSEFRYSQKNKRRKENSCFAINISPNSLLIIMISMSAFFIPELTRKILNW